MNDDIKILREALAKFAEFCEVDDGDPMEVPYRLYQKTNTDYHLACDPDRIRRLLDDAERYQWLRDGKTIKDGEEVRNRIAREIQKDKFMNHMIFFAWVSPEKLDEIIDQARKA